MNLYLASEPSKHTISPALRRVAFVAMIATYLLVVLGSTVRVSHSGMGCRSWPLCNGHLAPLENFHAAIEQFHRYLAAIVSILVFATGFLAWRHARSFRRVYVSALLSCLVIVVQVALGAVTVLTHNAPATVGMHLVTGLIELAIVTVVFVTAQTETDGTSHAHTQKVNVNNTQVLRLGISAVVATMAIIVTGAIVVDTKAAKSCPYWPLCSFGTAPTHLVEAQFLHRGIVFIGGVVLVIVFQRAWENWRPLGAGPLIILNIVVFVVQIAVGAIVALMKAPPALQDLHLGIAGIFWMGIVALATLAWVRVPRTTELKGPNNQDLSLDKPNPPLPTQL